MIYLLYRNRKFFPFLFKKKHYCFSGMGRHSMVRKLSCGHRVAGFVSRRLVKYRRIHWCVCRILVYNHKAWVRVLSPLNLESFTNTHVLGTERRGIPKGIRTQHPQRLLYNRIPERFDLSLSPKHACLQNFKLQKTTYIKTKLFLKILSFFNPLQHNRKT